MDHEENRYRSPSIPGEQVVRPVVHESWAQSLVIATVFAMLAVPFLFLLMTIFGFATLIEAGVSGRDWWRTYAERVLFADSRWQILPVSLFLFVSAFAVATSLLRFASALFRKPALVATLLASCCIAIATCTTGIVIAGLLILRT